MRGVIPTTENIVVAMWRVLEPAIAPARLTRLVLWETPNNYVEYDGTMSALAGQTALVSGASRGIGLAVARALAADGHARRHARPLGRRARGRAPRELGELALPLVCDVADPDAVAATRRARHRGRSAARRTSSSTTPDCSSSRPSSTTDPREFRARARRESRRAVSARARLPRARCAARGRGHIVTIGSIADRVAFPENGAYAASKFGLRALHEVLRAELRGSGVRATLVSPGPVDTALWDEIDPDTRPGFTPRARDAAGRTPSPPRCATPSRQPADVNVDELRLSRS